MEKFINTLDNSVNSNLMTHGTNGQLVYKDVSISSALISFDFKCIRGLETPKLSEMVSRILEQEKLETILRHLAFVRDIDKGKGERKVYYQYLYHIYQKYPIEITKLIELNIKNFGSWRDIKGLYDISVEYNDIGFQQELFNIIKKQLAIDMNNDKPSMLGKYLPGEKTKYKSMVKQLSKYLFTGNDKMKQYRKIKSQLTQKLNILERNLCSKTRSNIECNKIPALAMKKYKASLFNIGKRNTKKSQEEDNIIFAQRLKDYLSSQLKEGKGVSSKGIEIRDIVEDIVIEPNYNRELVKAFLQTIEPKIGDLSKVIPIIDTSGSMYGSNKEIYAALGIGILASMRSMEPFRNRFITFSEKPSWFSMEPNDTFEQRVKKATNAPWGYNTNYYATAELIVSALKYANVSPEQACDMTLLVLSDMQFDESDSGDSGASDTVMGNMRRIFGNAGYNVPTLVFWNLNGTTNGCPINSNEENTVMLSGFNQNMMNMFLNNPSNVNPEGILKDVLYSSRYNIVTECIE